MTTSRVSKMWYTGTIKMANEHDSGAKFPQEKCELMMTQASRSKVAILRMTPDCLNGSKTLIHFVRRLPGRKGGLTRWFLWQISFLFRIFFLDRPQTTECTPSSLCLQRHCSESVMSTQKRRGEMEYGKLLSWGNSVLYVNSSEDSWFLKPEAKYQSWSRPGFDEDLK